MAGERKSVVEDRWEYGSDFHLEPIAESDDLALPAWPEDAVYYGTGTQALESLLELGARSHGWRRVLFPDYYCQDVVDRIRLGSLDVCRYADDPIQAHVQVPMDRTEQGDVVVVINYFGLRSSADMSLDHPTGVAVVEDHTQAPFSITAARSQASYCFASLRKTLPIPDGGVVWSPRGSLLPEPPAMTQEHSAAVGQRLEAMIGKSLYLRGGRVEKAAFRQRFKESERQLQSARPSAMSQTSGLLIDSLPVDWLTQRASNRRYLTAAISDLRLPVKVLEPADSELVPSSASLLFRDPETRDDVRRYLVERRIYPAVHWPMDSTATPAIPDATIALSRRLLTLPCDARYASEDLDRVVTALRGAFA
jgi:hypothetical protein